MLQNIDLNKLNRIMEEDEDTKQIISQLLENHHTIVSSISHEIRNPLTLISSSLQIMEVTHPEIKAFHGWTQLMDDVQFIRLLLEDLSSLNNSTSLKYSAFPVSDLLKNIAVSFAMTLEHQCRGIEFTSLIPATLGTYTGDRLKLEEVILNLLQNARESIETTGTIRLSAARRKQALIIQIKDSGCGIPQEQLTSIFDPFTTYKPNGTGLGLAISKRIVEAHHGTLTVDSSPGKGSAFSIRLPL